MDTAVNSTCERISPLELFILDIFRFLAKFFVVIMVPFLHYRNE